MKKLPIREWSFFILVAAFSIYVWSVLSYPQFSFIDLSVNRSQATECAEEYLVSRGVDPKEFTRAVVFGSDDWSDRYLQKTIGIDGEKDFIRQHHYELFFWKVRFYKQLEKEEYKVRISPGSGEVIGFTHLIEDTVKRPLLEKRKARDLAEDFFRQSYGVDFNDYLFHEEKAKRLENRTDYNFFWEKEGVYIPWKKDEGGAKLLIGATVSGEEIRSFNNGSLDIPEKFQRFIAKEAVLGEYLITIHHLITIFLIAFATFLFLRRRDDIVACLCRRWFSFLAVLIIALNLIAFFNNIQEVFYAYPTSASMGSFLGILFLKVAFNLAILGFLIIAPGLSGELLASEVMPERPYSTFRHYLSSSFYSRAAARGVSLGYCFFFILIGLQSLLFYLGQRFLGVWKEWYNFTQFSSSYLPFLMALAVGITASFKEEVLFRLFGISWAKKYFKSTALAILLTALIWGIGHTQYAVYPVWFRGVEVTVMGILFGVIFIKYGIIPVIVAHYLFDVFWGVSAYIFGKSTPYLFWSSVVLLLFPFCLGVFAYLKNKEDRERTAEYILSDLQKYNMGLLLAYIGSKKSEGLNSEELSKELISHNWDVELVKLAISKAFGN